MSKSCVYLAILTIIFAPLATIAQNFDPEAVSQVSKAIAEWKLMNESEAEEQQVYVSSSLSPKVELGTGQGINAVSGLAAFGDNYWLDLERRLWRQNNQIQSQIRQRDLDRYWLDLEMKQWRRNNRIESQIRQWEMNSVIRTANRNISRLPTNPWMSLRRDLAIRVPQITYNYYWDTQYAMANVFWKYQGKYALIKRPWLSRAASAGYTIGSSVISAGITFAETVDRIGRSMQVMNPPVYLKQKTPWGVIGEGSYSIPGGRVRYYETLDTSATHWRQPGTITRIHVDYAETDFGKYVRHVETRTPASSFYDRFWMHHYPIGTWFEPGKTVMSETMMYDNLTYRETILPGGAVYRNNQLYIGGVPQISTGLERWNRGTSIGTYRAPKISVPSYSIGQRR